MLLVSIILYFRKGHLRFVQGLGVKKKDASFLHSRFVEMLIINSSKQGR